MRPNSYKMSMNDHMKQLPVKLSIDPEIVNALGPDRAPLWCAAHADGSDNRVDADAVLDAAGYGVTFGVLSAVSQFFRKTFKNRGKSQEDLAAEKETAGINRTCAALEEMLREYFLKAQEGTIDGEALDELTDTLGTVQGYAREGRLKTPGIRELRLICDRMAAFTAALTGSPAGQPAPSMPAEEAFRFIGEQLIRQKKWIAGQL